jgi:hypothetical protein
MQAPKTTNKDFETCPLSWQLAVCSRVIDKGTHWNEYKQTDQHKISIVFESQHLMKEGEFAGEPFLLFANFNYSMYQGKALLCTFIENWRGKRFSSQDEADVFDLAKLIGQKAYMNVVKSEDGKFTNIQVIGPVPDGMTAPEIAGKTILIDQANLDPKEVEKLSDKMKAQVMSAKEQTEVGEFQQHGTTEGFTNSENPGAGLSDADAGFDDDIPFAQYMPRSVI